MNRETDGWGGWGDGAERYMGAEIRGNGGEYE